MQYGKVEICGVNTSRLCVLSEEEKKQLLQTMRSGDRKEAEKAREKFINGNPLLKKYVEGFQGREPLPPKIKYASLAMVWISLSISFYFSTSAVTHGILLLVGIILSIYFLRLKIR